MLALGEEFKNDRGSVTMLNRKTDIKLGEVEGGAIPVDGAYVSWDLPTATSCSQADLSSVVKALCSDIVGREFKRPNVPSEHIWRKLSLDMSEKKRNAHPAEANSSI